MKLTLLLLLSLYTLAPFKVHPMKLNLVFSPSFALYIPPLTSIFVLLKLAFPTVFILQFMKTTLVPALDGNTTNELTVFGDRFSLQYISTS